MDATLKRRMWKVAIIHFALSIMVGLRQQMFYNDDSSYQEAQTILWTKLISIIQPQFWLIGHFDPTDYHLRQLLATRPCPVVGIMILVLLVGSIPFFSICFGWLYTKLVDRLNHFPTLGRKAF